MSERDLPAEALRESDDGEPEQTENASRGDLGPEGDIEEADY